MQAAHCSHFVQQTLNSVSVNPPGFVKTDIKIKHEHNLQYHLDSAVLLAQEYAMNLMQTLQQAKIAVDSIYLTARKKFIAVKFVLENERDSVQFLETAHRTMPRPFRENSVIVSTPAGYIIRLKH